MVPSGKEELTTTLAQKVLVFLEGYCDCVKFFPIFTIQFSLGVGRQWLPGYLSTSAWTNIHQRTSPLYKTAWELHTYGYPSVYLKSYLNCFK